MQIVASRPRATKGNSMPTDQERQAEAVRYVYYTLAIMMGASVVGFLVLFNFTNFFRLATPL